MKKYRLAILTSHPIQYQTPLFQKLALQSKVDLTVYFCWDFGIAKETLDPEFGKKFKWDIPLLKGYKYKSLRNYFFRPSSQFWGQINPEIIRELTAEDYDALLVFGWNALTNWLAFITAFITNTPVLLRGENPLNQEFLKPKWKIAIKKIYLKWLFGRISAFLYIGEENKKFYRFYGAPEEKLFFAPYAVDNERFMAASKELKTKRKFFRKELGINNKAIVILFVGKLIDKKRPMDLLRAYEKLKTEIALVFVGDGMLQPELGKYVNRYNLKNVRLVGFKNQTELSQYYILSDILVLPSGVGETWGLVVNEAMCFGLPVITSDIAGCGADLVRSGENGFIFPTGDIGKLVDHLEDLIKNAKKRKKFGETSFKIVQNYSYEKDIKGILKALDLAR